MDSKLCQRQTTRFKRSSCSTRDSKTHAASLAMRQDTFFKKASELSTLCDIDVCVLYYNREGDLVRTWPEDKAKVKDMAFRFSQLSDKEKRKKNTNLSECLAKKLSQEKKEDLHKYSQKLSEMESSLEQALPVLQDHLRLLKQNQSRQQRTEPLTNPLSELPTPQYELPLVSPHEVPSDCGIVSQPLISSVSDDPPQQQWTDPSKFSLFMLNHDNGNLTKLSPPLMQTQNPLAQYASWNQTQSFGDPMMMFSSSYV